jgi:hypothetical protein
MSYTEKIKSSVDGYQIPNVGERAVYWPRQDYTDIFESEDFRPSFIQELIDSGEAQVLSPR